MLPVVMPLTNWSAQNSAEARNTTAMPGLRNAQLQNGREGLLPSLPCAICVAPGWELLLAGLQLDVLAAFNLEEADHAAGAVAVVAELNVPGSSFELDVLDLLVQLLEVNFELAVFLHGHFLDGANDGRSGVVGFG